MPCHPRQRRWVSRWRSSGTLSGTSAAGVFFSPCAQYDENRVGQHGQGDVAIPALPVAHFVMVQPALAFGSLEGLLDLPALSGHAYKRFERRFVLGRIKPVVGMLWLLFDAAPHQQSVAPTILFPAMNEGPVIKPFAFAA